MKKPIPILMAILHHCAIVIYAVLYSVHLYPFTAGSAGQLFTLICFLSALGLLFTNPNKGRWLSFSIFVFSAVCAPILIAQALSSGSIAPRVTYLAVFGTTCFVMAYLLARSKSVQEYIKRSETESKPNHVKIFLFLLMVVLLPAAYRYISKPSYDFQILDSRQPGEGEGFPNPNAPYKYIVYGDYAFGVDRFEILKRKLSDRYRGNISGKKLKINQFYITEIDLRPYATDSQGKEISSGKPDYTQISSVITVGVDGCFSSGSYDENFSIGYHADKDKVSKITDVVVESLLQDMQRCFLRYQNKDL